MKNLLKAVGVWILKFVLIGSVIVIAVLLIYVGVKENANKKEQEKKYQEVSEKTKKLIEDTRIRSKAKALRLLQGKHLSDDERKYFMNIYNNN